ncbi:MAG TPA: diguanylate cyclase [Elusimicrobia bacterium]|nr:diguanylate cyclase [Elusimicrobiota bacterium]
MRRGAWLSEFPVAVTVCDRRGRVLEMNRKACETFERYGGRRLVGKSLLSCHSPRARRKLRGLLRTGRVNVYTIEKKGARKLIYQGPWFAKGRLAGLVELSLVLPKKVPHFVRKG